MSIKFILNPGYEQFATEKQWAYLTAWEKHGSQIAAAEACGVAHSNIDGAWSAVKKKAARANFVPGYGHVGVAPEGLTSAGISALRDGDGKVLQVWDKVKPAGLAPEDAIKPTDAMTLAGLSTMTGDDGSVKVQWARHKPELVKQAQLWEAFAETLSKKIVAADPIPAPRGSRDDDKLAAFVVGDHHLGMLAWDKETDADYDIKIGSRLLDDAVANLISRAPDCGTALLAVLGDFMHYDSMQAVTPTSKNLLDSDSRFPKMVWMATEALIRAVDQLRAAYPKVHVILEVGNHDLTSSIWMMRCVSLYYRDEPRVTVDTSPKHFHYFRWGKCLIGTHHGHGTKADSLPGIMAQDRPEDWGETRHRYFWIGHLHHWKKLAALDHVGCEVEQFRVLATQDAWAAQHGYRSRRDMKVITLHREYGKRGEEIVTPEEIAA